MYFTAKLLGWPLNGIFPWCPIPCHIPESVVLPGCSPARWCAQNFAAAWSVDHWHSSPAPWYAGLCPWCRKMPPSTDDLKRTPTINGRETFYQDQLSIFDKEVHVDTLRIPVFLKNSWDLLNIWKFSPLTSRQMGNLNSKYTWLTNYLNHLSTNSELQGVLACLTWYYMYIIKSLECAHFVPKKGLVIPDHTTSTGKTVLSSYTQRCVHHDNHVTNKE